MVSVMHYLIYSSMLCRNKPANTSIYCPCTVPYIPTYVYSWAIATYTYGVCKYTHTHLLHVVNTALRAFTFIILCSYPIYND